MTTLSVGKPTLAQNLSAALAETWLRVLSISRYPGQLVLDMIMPTVFAAIPLLLGRASAGANAAANFQATSGTANYVAFMLIGSSVFNLVSSAFWVIAHWLRFEQETGTLEAVYLTPTPTTTLVIGVALYSAIRGLALAVPGYLIGCLVFQVNPLDGDVALALAFILVGLIPLYGLAMLFGALVLKVKESNALVGLMQWVLSFFMGIFFPLSVMPGWLRAVALLFPPTWMTNGARAALLGVGFFFEKWYLDFAMLWVFMAIVPLLGFTAFTRMETHIKRNEGVGQF